MKQIVIILLLFTCIAAKAQYIPNSGSYQYPKIKTVNALQIPTGTGNPVTSINAPDSSFSGVYYNKADTSLYLFNPVAKTWGLLRANGSGGIEVDSVFITSIDSIFITTTDSIFIVSGVDTLFIGINNGGGGANLPYNGDSTYYLGGDTLLHPFTTIIVHDTCCGDSHLSNDTLFISHNGAPILQDGLISPGYVTWSGSGLTFDVTSAYYVINGTTYQSAAGQVTLDPADPTNPRIDVIAVDSTGAIVAIAGTPSANPSEPQVDPASQVLLTSILILAGATTPGVTQTIVYDQNTDAFTGAATSITANFNSTTNPYHLTKSVDVSPWISTGNIIFTQNSGASTVSDYSFLKLYIWLKQATPAGTNMSLAFLNGNTVVSSSLTLGVALGFLKGTDSAWQNISIPLSSFHFTSNTFNKLRITFTGTAGGGAYIDYVQLQGNILPPPTGNPYPVNYSKNAGNDSTILLLNNGQRFAASDNTRTQAQVRSDISLTTTGSSGAATYNNSTGVLNVPQYSGSGGADTTKEFRTNLYGTLYNRNAWANTNDFAINGATVSASSSVLNFSAGANTFTQTADIKPLTGNDSGYTCLERWVIRDTVIITEKSATSYGNGIGIRSYSNGTKINSGVYFDASTGAASGKIKTFDGFSGVTNTSTSAITFSVNDTIILILERNVDSLYATAFNQTTKAALITTSTYAFHNTGRFCIYSLGGTFKVSGLSVISGEPKKSNLMLVGDSKIRSSTTNYYYASMAGVLQQTYPSLTVNAGASDYTDDLLKRTNEIIALLPRQILMEIGYNDIAGTGLATYQANIASIVSTLQAAGIRVYLFNPYSSISNYTTLLDTYFRATFPSLYISTVFTSTKNIPNTLQGDGVHLSDLGHLIASNEIIKSAALTDGATFNPLAGLKVNAYGNYGNIQISRNGIFATPSSDSLTFSAGLQTKGNALFGTTTITGTATPQTVSFGGTVGIGPLGATANQKWYLYDDATASGRFGIGMSSGYMDIHAGATGGINFSTNNGTNAMTMLSTGNIGIGTGTSISDKLHVNVGASVAGVSVDGTVIPYFALRKSGTAIGYFAVTSSTFQWFQNVQVEDLILASISTRRVVIGSQATAGTLRTAGIVVDTGNFVGINTLAPVSGGAVRSNLDVNGSFGTAYVAKTGTYTATSADQTIDCTSGTFTVTLPTAVGIIGRIYTIVNSGSGAITIATTSSQTFTNITSTPTTLSLAAVGAAAIVSYTVKSTGTNWVVVAKVKNE